MYGNQSTAENQEQRKATQHKNYSSDVRLKGKNGDHPNKTDNHDRRWLHCLTY
jgi:hypothetical protein